MGGSHNLHPIMTQVLSLFVQVLMQMAMKSIQQFDGTDREATIPWLDHDEAVARKRGFDPLEISMIKLKAMALWYKCNY